MFDHISIPNHYGEDRWGMLHWQLLGQAGGSPLSAPEWACSDEDGNPEFDLDNDPPTEAEQDAAWKDYWEWVADYGVDPLRQVPSYLKHKAETWVLLFTQHFVSKTANLIRVRKKVAGSWIAATNAGIPSDVLNFLVLEETAEKRGDVFTFKSQTLGTLQVFCEENDLEFQRDAYVMRIEMTAVVERSAGAQLRAVRKYARKMLREHYATA